jgi:hypothetical protein
MPAPVAAAGCLAAAPCCPTAGRKRRETKDHCEGRTQTLAREECDQDEQRDGAGYGDEKYAQAPREVGGVGLDKGAQRQEPDAQRQHA